MKPHKQVGKNHALIWQLEQTTWVTKSIARKHPQRKKERKQMLRIDSLSEWENKIHYFTGKISVHRAILVFKKMTSPQKKTNNKNPHRKCVEFSWL